MANHVEVRISGVGGQGVVLAGQILGRAAAYEGRHVVQTQSYGAEARGSAAKSEVIISDSRIGFPKVRKCDILIAMSQSAVKSHMKDLKAKGILLVDADIVEQAPKTMAQVFKIPATETAETVLASKLYANVVMLGALIGITGIVRDVAVETAIIGSVPERAREANIRAFRAGLNLSQT